MAADILANLNSEQREAVLHFSSPLLIVAGAGSGKTRVITHKIAHLVMNQNVLPSHILGVTFTNRAADEMKLRIEALTGCDSRLFAISTFHSFGLRLLRETGRICGFGPEWKVIDDEEQRKIIEKLAKAHFPNYTSDFRDAACRQFNLSKMNLRYPNNPESLRERFLSEEEITLFTLYHDFLKNNHFWDFEDLISLPVRLLMQNEELADKYRKKYSHVLIDEFQDINPNQYELIRIMARGSQHITAVGDDDQAIYSWRGANVRFLFDYERDFPGTKVVKLEQNYRSTRRILDFANHLISFNYFRKGKQMWSATQEGNRVYLLRTPSKQGEGEQVAQLILKLQEKRPDLFPLAVLYRINSQSLPLETALINCRIPFKILKGLRFFERKEIKDCIALLRLAFNPSDDLAFIRLVDFLPLGIGEKSLTQLTLVSQAHSLSLLSSLQEKMPDKVSHQPLLGKIIEISKKTTPVEVPVVLRELLNASRYLDILEERGETERILNIEALIDFIDTWQREYPQETFSDLLDRITVQSVGKNNGVQEKVYLLTMHNAKGLEFQTVIAAGINSSYMPFFLSKERAEIEEERRLLYVACTRSMQLLVLSTGSDRLSPFLMELDASRYSRIGSVDEFVSELSSGGEPSSPEVSGKFLLHPLFGKGRIMELVSIDKYLVNFGDQGNKIIDVSVVSVQFL